MATSQASTAAAPPSTGQIASAILGMRQPTPARSPGGAAEEEAAPGPLAHLTAEQLVRRREHPPHVPRTMAAPWGDSPPPRQVAQLSVAAERPGALMQLAVF